MLHRISLALLPFILAASIAKAQTTFASITGTVTDAQGSIVRDAKIEATHVASNYIYSTQSNDAGNYTLAQLREGDYVLRATAPGFNAFEVKEIRLVARDIRRIDIGLTVGAVSTTVDVTAGATVIETETARISQTRSSYAIKALPLGRDLWSQLAIAPGVNTSTELAFRRFAGSKLNQSSASIDGVTTDDLEGGNQISPLVGYVDSYNEVRIDSVNNTAEFGAIGNVTVISKSGTNEFHGNAFDYYSTPWFRARNPFAARRGTGVNHQPGASIGGPVRIPRLYNGKDKTFFFFSFETNRGSDVQQTLNPTVPIAAWREGDFSGLLAQGIIVRNPLTGVAYPNNRIPASDINSVSRKIQERFYPLPNFGNTSVLENQNYRELVTRSFDPSTYLTMRGDHRFSDKVQAFARYTWQRQWNRTYESNLPTVGQRWNQRNTRALASSISYGIRPNLLYEARYGLNFDNNPIHGPIMGRQNVSELGIQGLMPDLPDISGMLNVNFSGIPIQSLSQISYDDPGNRKFGHIAHQNLNWFHGRHSVRAGVSFAYVEWDQLQANANLFGNVNFSNRFTGHPYADFLLGIPTAMTRGPIPTYNQSTRSAWDFYIQDDFKITSRLTLNLGLRYEYHPYWSEGFGRLSNFDLATGSIVVPDGSLGKISPLWPANFAPIVEASQVGFEPKKLIRNDLNNWAPRVGLAWRPFGINTVLRAGFGIFYDNVPAKVNQGNSPYVLNEPTYTNPVNNPDVRFPFVFPTTGTGSGQASLPSMYPQDLQIAKNLQYSFTIEHQIGQNGFRASYVGTATRGGIYRYNLNQPVADSRLFIEKPRPFPQFSAVNLVANGAGHQYNGLTLEAKRPLTNGLMIQASWVYARDIGDLNQFQFPEDSWNLERERAVWTDIPTHRIGASFIYMLPFGKGRPWFSNAGRAFDTAFGGWELSVVNIYQTGMFLTPLWTGPDPTGTAFTTNSTPPNVTIRPNILRDANLPSDQRTVSRWFDASAFAAPARGSFGSAAKGVVIGPGSAITHVSLAKYIRLWERLSLRPEISAFNVFNHPNWANPGMNITSAPGVISGVVGRNDLDSSGPRSLRASLRLEW